MTTLRRFTPPTKTTPTKTNILHVQESIQPDDVRIQIEQITGNLVEVAMTQAQFRELCRLGVLSPYYRDPDTVRFQPPIDPYAE
jgi:hypothetical protein